MSIGEGITGEDVTADPGLPVEAPVVLAAVARLYQDMVGHKAQAAAFREQAAHAHGLALEHEERADDAELTMQDTLGKARSDLWSTAPLQEDGTCTDKQFLAAAVMLSPPYDTESEPEASRTARLQNVLRTSDQIEAGEPTVLVLTDPEGAETLVHGIPLADGLSSRLVAQGETVSYRLGIGGNTILPVAAWGVRKDRTASELVSQLRATVYSGPEAVEAFLAERFAASTASAKAATDVLLRTEIGSSWSRLMVDRREACKTLLRDADMARELGIALPMTPEVRQQALDVLVEYLFMPRGGHRQLDLEANIADNLRYLYAPGGSQSPDEVPQGLIDLLVAKMQAVEETRGWRVHEVRSIMVDVLHHRWEIPHQMAKSYAGQPAGDS